MKKFHISNFSIYGNQANGVSPSTIKFSAYFKLGAPKITFLNQLNKFEEFLSTKFLNERHKFTSDSTCISLGLYRKTLKMQ